MTLRAFAGPIRALTRLVAPGLVLWMFAACAYTTLEDRRPTIPEYRRGEESAGQKGQYLLLYPPVQEFATPEPRIRVDASMDEWLQEGAHDTAEACEAARARFAQAAADMASKVEKQDLDPSVKLVLVRRWQAKTHARCVTLWYLKHFLP